MALQMGLESRIGTRHIWNKVVLTDGTRLEILGFNEQHHIWKTLSKDLIIITKPGCVLYI